MPCCTRVPGSWTGLGSSPPDTWDSWPILAVFATRLDPDIAPRCLPMSQWHARPNRSPDVPPDVMIAPSSPRYRVMPLSFSWLYHPLLCLHLSSTFTSHRASHVRLVVAFPSASASPSCCLCPAPRSAIHHASPLRRAHHLTRLVVVTRPPPLVAHLSFDWLLHCPVPQPILRTVVVFRVITLLPSVGLRLLPLIRDSARRYPLP